MKWTQYIYIYLSNFLQTNITYKWTFNNTLDNVVELLPPQFSHHDETSNHVRLTDDGDTYASSNYVNHVTGHQMHHHHSSKSKHHRYGHGITKMSKGTGEASTEHIYPYKVESSQSYGTVTCHAHSPLGRSGPCMYQIMAADVPDAVRNCSAYNATASSIQINCVPGKDGGIQQYFHVKIIDDNRQLMLYNTSYKHSDFMLKRLPSDSLFLIKIMAYNQQGSSEPFQLRAKTLPAPLLRTGLCSPHMLFMLDVVYVRYSLMHNLWFHVQLHQRPFWCNWHRCWAFWLAPLLHCCSSHCAS